MQQTKYYPLIGGENLSQPAITISHGELLSSLNYECVTEGGYRRLDGYERFDGQTAPSEQGYTVLNFTAGNAAFLTGDTITGLTSGASGEVIAVNLESGSYAGSDAAGTVAIVDKSGTFVDTDPLQVSAVTRATQAGVEATSSGEDATDSTYLQAAEEWARAIITTVPGSGPIRGVWFFNDVLYAFRDNAGATACVMHKSTATGWQTVTTPALTAGGKYRFVTYNFGASTGTVKMYGCDGANKAFEFDGTTFTQITTGMTTDTPIHITAHKRHLFLAFPKGSVQHSPIGDPTGAWSVVTGAGEIGTGDEIVGFQTLQGDILAIFNRNRTYLLQGTSTADWNLVTFSDESGAVEDSVQRIGSAMYADDRGITTLEAVQAFGDFNSSTISQKINKKLIGKLNQIESSVRIKSRDQYRLFFTDGSGVCCTYSGNKLVGFTSLLYTNPVLTTCNAEDSTGQERVFFGSDDGVVYEMGKGTSHDGQPLVSILRLVFNHVGSPVFNKRFFKVLIELEALGESTLQFSADYSYADIATPAPYEQSFLLKSGGGFFDFSNWDEIVWDGQPVSTAEAYLDGIGKNVGLTIYSSQTYEKSHTLQGVVIQYSGRGIAK